MKTRNEMTTTRSQEVVATWIGRLLAFMATWSLVSVILILLWPRQVEAVVLWLDFTNIPSYPSVFWAFFLGILTSGFLRRLRAALWSFLILFQWPNLIFVALSVYESVALKMSYDEAIGAFWPAFVYGVVAIIFTAVLLWAYPAFPGKLAPGSWWKAIGVFALGITLNVAAVALILEIIEGWNVRLSHALRWALNACFDTAPGESWPSAVEGSVILSAFASICTAAIFFLAVSTFLKSGRLTQAKHAEEELAVRRHLLTAGDDSLGYFATRDERRIVSTTAPATISYRVVNGVCLAAGDPLGPREFWTTAVAEWLHLARCNGWVPAVVSCSTEAAQLYEAAGLHVRIMGDESIIDVATFQLQHPRLAQVRHAIAGPINAGYDVKIRRQVDIPPAELAQIAHLADLWRRGETERGFSMASGRIGDPRDRRTVVVTAHDAAGDYRAMLSFVPWGRHGLSLDVMRRSPEAISGVTELMVTRLIATAPTLGVSQISLNFAMFRSSFTVGEQIGASLSQRLVHKVLVLASRWWQLQSLYKSNLKYNPTWKPRLLCYSNSAHLTRTLIAMAEAEGFVPEIHFQLRKPLPPSPEQAEALVEAIALQETELLTVLPPTRRLPEQERVRHAKLATMRDAGIDPYPAGVARTHSLAELHELYDGTQVSVVGRIMRLRDHGGVLFADIRESVDEYQVMFTTDQPANLAGWRASVDRGDIVSVTGTLTKSRSGEPSIHATSWQMAAKCLVVPPDKYRGLVDPETRMRQRHMDIATSTVVENRIRARALTARATRDVLTARGYLEVETPILQRIHGGANARPFRTHINAYEQDLYLRIAPELFLKRLCVGGLEKVFEIGRNFRNEGADATHNPEFTALEAYEAFGDYLSMRDLTRELIIAAAIAVHGEPVAPRPDGTMMRLDGEWKSITVHEAVSQACGRPINTDTPATVLRDICAEHGIEVSTDATQGALVTELYDELVEGQTIEPTFYMDFPLDTSPLTAPHRSNPALAERWDLVACGMELGTAYTELTDPVDQRHRLTEQSLLAATGNVEAMEVDDEFLAALEFGMRPTGGLGIGMDRLTMFLVNAPIRETMPFPFVRPESR